METPRYEYSRAKLKASAKYIKSLKAPFGYNPKYAVKANPHPEIIKIFYTAGLGFDASSSYEAQHLLDCSVSGDRISLSSQQSAHNLRDLVDAGVKYIATSMRQLEEFAALEKRPDSVGIRINPGVGSGYYKRFTTGGVGASFGIWHEKIDEVLAFTDKTGLKVDHLQIHIGTGTDPEVWSRGAHESLDIVSLLPDVKTLNLGGGFKTAYHPDDKEADMESIFDAISDVLVDYADDHDRKIELEIEPGRYLVVHAGTLVAEVDDIVDTGAEGYTFLRINTGMNDFLRPSMYGAYHNIQVLNDETETKEYVVVGHNCETGDTLTTKRDDPETIATRTLKKASIGDKIAIYDTGAYCASMRARGYNAFPDAVEVMVD